MFTYKRVEITCWSFIEKTSVKQSIKQQVCSNFQTMFTDQMYPLVEASGNVQEYYVRSSLHSVQIFRQCVQISCTPQ